MLKQACVCLFGAVEGRCMSFYVWALPDFNVLCRTRYLRDSYNAFTIFLVVLHAKHIILALKAMKFLRFHDTYEVIPRR